jgi:FkbM family methyltransferase
MAINRKRFLRETGAAAAGATLGAVARGLVAPDIPAPERGAILQPTEGWATSPSAKGPPPPMEAVGHLSYAQSGEDLIVAFMAYYLGISEVTYLDVGANDPVELSNTYYFYKGGRRGVLVEPNRSLCRRLREVRPGDTVLEAGIGVTAAGEADYYVMTFDGLNTFSKEEADHWVESSRGKIAIQQVIRVPLLNINDVMERHFRGAPAFLSIDTEGMDLAILRSIDYGRFRPAIICAETLVADSRAARPEIPEFLSTRGYAARGGSFVNTIFVDAKRL